MALDQPAGLKPRNTQRGRPRTTGDCLCARCGRFAGKFHAHWPEGGICGICFATAMRTTGTCPSCRTQRLLPGAPGQPGGPSGSVHLQAQNVRIITHDNAANHG